MPPVNTDVPAGRDVT